jgi:hypothetical protein
MGAKDGEGVIKEIGCPLSMGEGVTARTWHLLVCLGARVFAFFVSLLLRDVSESLAVGLAEVVTFALEMRNCSASTNESERNLRRACRAMSDSLSGFISLIVESFALQKEERKNVKEQILLSLWYFVVFARFLKVST